MDMVVNIQKLENDRHRVIFENLENKEKTQIITDDKTSEFFTVGELVEWN